MLKGPHGPADTSLVDPRPRPQQQCCTAGDGFTLVELLVVMVVLGLLAAIAVPAMATQRRKAYEASAKADVKAITKDLMALYVDGGRALEISGSAGTWEIRDGASVVAVGRLSEHNLVSTAGYGNDSTDFCLSVLNTEGNAQFWTADDVGLHSGDG